MQRIIRPSRPSRPRKLFRVAGLLFGAALLSAGAMRANPSTPVQSTLTATLKPISQVDLQTMVASTGYHIRPLELPVSALR
jgi:hypothetical protein